MTLILFKIFFTFLGNLDARNHKRSLVLCSYFCQCLLHMDPRCLIQINEWMNKNFAAQSVKAGWLNPNLLTGTRRFTFVRLKLRLMFRILLTLERHEIFRIGLCIFEDDEDSGIADVVGDRVVAELGAWTLRRFLHVWSADIELTGQHSTLEHVLDSLRVRWRVCSLSRVGEIHRKVNALPIHRRCCAVTQSRTINYAVQKKLTLKLIKWPRNNRIFGIFRDV